MSTYNRVATPRAYMDRLSFDLATGRRTMSNYTIIQDDGSTAVTFDGGQFEDLFDMRPSNYATIAHDNQQFYITIDTGMTSATVAETNFLAILGHNFHSSNAVFNVWHSGSAAFDDTPVNLALSSEPTDVINAEENDPTSSIDPASNGWTLITWPTTSTKNQYLRIYIASDSGSTSNFATDVKIGCIMAGEYIDFPHSPDLNVEFDIDYDGTDIVTSAGGGTFANTSSLGSPPWGAGNPWVLGSEDTHAYKSARHYGRRKWNMNMSYVSDTDMFLSNMHAGHGAMIDGSDLYSQFFAKTLGAHQPFLFTIDKDSTDEGDYGLYRLANGSMKSTQTANRFWNTNLSLVEHW